MLLGHILPVWHRFRGGRGVATAIGALVYLAPFFGLALAALWLVMTLIGRLASVASLVAMALYAMALRPIGFIVATALFLSGGSFILGERRYLIMIPIALTGAFAIWYLVQEMLGIFLRPWPWFIA